MPKYYIWTIGCQMNKAESQRVADYLELLGYQATLVLQKADLVLLNTCVVRQSAEGRVIGTLGYLKGIKNSKPDLAILVTGCFVDSDVKQLQKSFPHVDLFFKPGDYIGLLDWAEKQGIGMPENGAGLPSTKNVAVSTFVPIIQGCNNFCSYCIVPYRRGRERSRPVDEIVCEVSELVKHGAKEVTLLGQNVNSYGHDLPTQPDLSDLLTELNNINGLDRMRFLTNHPKDMSQQLIQAIASLDKVCKHISLPLQAGDNDVLKAMRRGYTVEQYRQLVGSIRNYIPEVALSTDVIVGFPGESEEQFERTLAVLEEVRFDTVHVAVYSPRPGTIASREYEDNVPPELKKERLNGVETLQANIAGEISSQLIGKAEEVLVEGKKGGKWYGRTRSNKLVFFESCGDCLRRLVDVIITKTSPWALQGEIAIGDTSLEEAKR
ncbi:MAG: tRNA (N6-isopentenyl adenosine(37)-C2)-methylthiotransferase MiaB [Chloroflexi bacterium]|nr:tRNA (N6-isopentenyl adenosine(37)-C2)-methylthiotransferase MiaB [Chloroflexota bacterium]